MFQQKMIYETFACALCCSDNLTLLSKTGVEYSILAYRFEDAVGSPLDTVNFPIDLQVQVVGTRIVSILCTSKVV